MITILTGDCRETLRSVEAGSVQCCVTSPPYWGLRDYGMEGQLGLEKTPEEYVEKMVAVFREVRRVMRGDGTLWLNLGDSYCSQGGMHDGRDDNQPGVGASRVWRNGSGRADGIVDQRGQRNRNGNAVIGLKPKDLVGIPWRVAFALQADGWWLRQDIIWAKPNPMPESVTDRCTKAHEYLFLLTKSERYFYDNVAIQEAAIRPGDIQTFGGAKSLRTVIPADDPRSRGGSEQWGRTVTAAETRNKRSVWEVATQPYADAHFATFPPDLIRPCILAGSRPGDIVLDPFGGSGTTGQVAIEYARRVILCELNPEYVKLAQVRTLVTPGLGI